ncbi:MAG TPA: glucokinase, partial [Calidithermus sp.]|nr:glucokinase [Calidithermus sp.]
GDVGATKTALALFDEQGPDLSPARSATLPSRAHAGLEEAVRAFLAAGPPVRVTAACFGVPGPVVDGRAEPTNLAWRLDEAALAAAIPAPRVRLVNDLVATAHGVLALGPEALLTLQPGRPRAGNLAVIAAGTGLGEAIVVRDGERRLVVATEGGHADFAPRTDLEVELLRALAKQFGHVSWERVLSGPGLVETYRFLRERSARPEPDWLRERLAGDDPAAVVAEAALEGRDPVCGQALDLFVSVYGAEAGNLALKALALGGVYVAGGIAPKIRRRLARGDFLAAFADKGRLGGLMASIPVHVVLEPAAALLGAARCARALAAGEQSP